MSGYLSDFQVCIIESPSLDDLHDGMSEGAIIKAILELSGIPCLLRMATTEYQFKGACCDGLLEMHSKRGSQFPIYHISAHGNEHGIQFTDRGFLTWQALSDILCVLNGTLDNELFLCMSTCMGFSFHQQMLSAKDSPCAVLVGTSGKPTWQETACAFHAFYHLLQKGESFVSAMNGMKSASGHNMFQSSKDEQVQSVEDAMRKWQERRRNPQKD